MIKSFQLTALVCVVFTVNTSCNRNSKQSMPIVETNIFDTGKQPMTVEQTDSMIPIADNSRISIDWAGTYRGIVPCADCEGIKTELVLDMSGTYRLGTLHLGKRKAVPVFREGKFEWDKTGNKILLKEIAEGEGPRHFQVGEEKVFQLDQQGNRITGQMAERYILNKYYPDTILTGKYWKLIEINGKKIAKMLKEPYMLINDLQVRGNGGCNTFSGSVKITPMNRIVFQNLVSTKMACMGDDGSPSESLFFDALNKADQYLIQNDTLSLSKARMAPLARFVFDYFKE